MIRSKADVRAVIDGALANSECVVISIYNAVVGSQSEALECFRAAASFRRMRGDFEIMFCRDDAGMEAHGFDINTPTAIYIYGVSGDDLMLHLADLAGRMQ